MMRELHARRGEQLTVFLMIACLLSGVAECREKEVEPATVRVSTGQKDCVVELDNSPSRRTDTKGSLVLAGVDPTDHYVHVQCPGGQPEGDYLISPRPGKSVEIRQAPGSSLRVDPALSPLEAAEAKLELRREVRHAVQLRAEGHLEEAVGLFRKAAQADPENSDLHRELGITFLLGKEWKRARVEMLEAIRRDPEDADAHNGLGYALEKLGDLNTALGEYRIATRLEPDDPVYRQHYFDALSRAVSLREQKKK